MDPDKFALRWLKEETLAHVSLPIYGSVKNKLSVRSEICYSIHTPHAHMSLPPFLSMSSSACTSLSSLPDQVSFVNPDPRCGPH